LLGKHSLKTSWNYWLYHYFLAAAESHCILCCFCNEKQSIVWEKKRKAPKKTPQGHCIWNMCLVTWSWLPKGIRIHIFVLLYTWVAWIMYCSLSLFGLCSLAGQPSKRFTLNSSYIQHKSHLASEDQSYINQQALRNW